MIYLTSSAVALSFRSGNNPPDIINLSFLARLVSKKRVGGEVDLYGRL